MFNIFKKKPTEPCNRFVTCYLVCNRDEHTQYIANHMIPKPQNRRALFLQERCARDYISQRNDKRLVIMILRIPEDQITLFPMNDITCECNNMIDIAKYYEQTIYPQHNFVNVMYNIILEVHL